MIKAITCVLRVSLRVVEFSVRRMPHAPHRMTRHGHVFEIKLRASKHESADKAISESTK